ncbi:MAG: hypothetical protein NTZ26_15615, partial [Candidatus Aminicenantes bacterium]|nr:hypothetical protein [Candidatus Aminicenantes bacterium]
FTGQDLFNQIDGGAELFLEFGFARMRLQAFARGKSELTLNAYEMESAASALGIYLMKMGKETPFAEVAARNSSEEVQLTVVKGRFFVQVDNLGDVPAAKAEAVALANTFLAGVPMGFSLTSRSGKGISSGSAGRFLVPWPNIGCPTGCRSPV